MSVQYDGSIRINAKIDTDGVEKDIENISDRLEQLEKGAGRDITIKPTVDSSQAESELTKIAGQVSAIDTAPASVEVSADTGVAQSGLNSVQQAAQQLDGTPVSVKAGADVKSAKNGIDTVQKAADALDNTDVNIEPKVDTKQAENGIARITDGLKGLATAAGLAFGIKAVIDFGKDSVTAATNLENALKGLQSIAEGQGKSFEDARAFIDEYISDGLVPATEAVTAYKNLLARGYDTSQIEDLMIRLKDAAAFGRQASYSLGEAIASATEGLKNENSVLVDNAGVTKNVAKMWQEYAREIGTTTEKLTDQQKREAEYNGIMEETRYQIGDAEKLTDGYSGKVAQLEASFFELKTSLGTAVIPTLAGVVDVLKVVVDAIGNLTENMDAEEIKTFSTVLLGFLGGFIALVTVHKLGTLIYDLGIMFELFASKISIANARIVGASAVLFVLIALLFKLADAWGDMTGAERFIAVLALVTAGALAAFLAVGMFQSALTAGIAIAGIVAGIAVLMGVMKAAETRAKAIPKATESAFSLESMQNRGTSPFSSQRGGGFSIPRLAHGAVIPPNREFLAVLGDQKRGTNIEAPLSTIEEAVENVLARRGNAGTGGEVRVVLEFDDKPGMGRYLRAKIKEADKLAGVSLVNG